MNGVTIRPFAGYRDLQEFTNASTIYTDMEGYTSNTSLTVAKNETLRNNSDEIGDNLKKFMYVIIVAGTLMNVAFLIVVARHKSMGSITNVYLSNLAVADVGVLALSLMAILPDPIPTILLFGPYGCAYIVLVSTTYFASIATVSLMTWHRYYAICHPLKYRVVDSKKRSVKLVVAAWCFSLVCSCLMSVGNILADRDCLVLSADMKNTDVQHQNEVLLIDIVKPLLVMMSLSFNFILYQRIIKSLRRRILYRSQWSLAPKWVKNIRNARMVMTRMLAVNTSIFFICNCPRSVLLILKYIQVSVGVTPFEHQAVTVISSGLLLANSCVNPLIYTLTNVAYRRAIREVFLPRSCWSTTAHNKKVHINFFT